MVLDTALSGNGKSLNEAQGLSGRATSAEGKRNRLIEEAQVKPEASLPLLAEVRSAETPLHFFIEAPNPLVLKKFAPRALTLKTRSVRNPAVGLEIRHLVLFGETYQSHCDPCKKKVQHFVVRSKKLSTYSVLVKKVAETAA